MMMEVEMEMATAISSFSNDHSPNTAPKFGQSLDKFYPKISTLHWKY